MTEQTSVTAENQLEIHTGEHTQLNGALINSDTGKLTLDTQTLGFASLAGLDKEHSYYLNVGGSYGLSGITGGAQDPSQTGKGKPGVNGWSVQGYNASTDREQEVRATVGAGEIVVRGDAKTGDDSTVGLNRDPDKAYEITRDEQHRTDVYASSSSISAVAHPSETVTQWAHNLVSYDQTARNNFNQAALIVGNQIDRVQHPGAGEGAIAAGGEKLAEQTLSALVEAGVGRSDARELLADKDFQTLVLRELADMAAAQNANPSAIAELKNALIEPLTGEKIF
ncbi:hypothetical protein [Pseudomonas sp. Marseille-Q5115]|uniref:hypothetical protein n=1 Tax=Pseudomonas sp. Marseille-Q5115 TaxID=2866593 RepID=UPI001CE49990|nr:hypothetical protein [Pseudomonas sp. Marseille-Q5115]